MDNSHFHTTKDVLKKVGVTRPTLYKWLKQGKVPEVSRDRNNFRLFTKKDMDNITNYKNLIRKPTIHNSNMNNNNGAQPEVKRA